MGRLAELQERWRLQEYAEDVDWIRTLTQNPPGDAMHDAVALCLRRIEKAVAAAG